MNKKLQVALALGMILSVSVALPAFAKKTLRQTIVHSGHVVIHHKPVPKNSSNSRKNAIACMKAAVAKKRATLAKTAGLSRTSHAKQLAIQAAQAQYLIDKAACH